MLKVICSISILLSGAALTACGQSGALHLPSDLNYDKRAKYLLYSSKDAEQQAQKNATEEKEKSSASEPTPSP
ncbi:lipoprotein [Acinetobacter ursingii]|uniref:LPS translocon maturation chaperone LptM n=1 Tax=Acinetobacter ursingii TaxID=108980 RepID=UPI00244D702D|nr:lipoprotein [Acinetobacter ursingii]MDG9859892.1 lipoprotein [Acinetobacter ursingii]MDG9893630.1 lipoprotein [Acinetobacter ursingii]MDH0007613.1 lipoprotein [Acinetobacter ursingii]MDH0478899.1 lipoprotein [Acinetobacter ursingii]MDH2119630.1 lipoprotein [Acinetobacter ursingii]